MRSAKSAALVSLLLAAPALSPAAEGTSLPLGLTEAVERAREASPRLDRLRFLQSGAEAGLRGAKAGRLPLLSLSASYTRNSDVPEFQISLPDGSTQSVFPNIPNATRTRADLTQPLYTGGRVGSEIRSAESLRLASAGDLAAGQGDLVLEVTEAYWSLVRAREAERVLREAIVSYEAHLRDVGNLMEAGMAARNDLLTVQVARDRAELARLEAANRLETANANLQRLLALPPSTRVDPTDPAEAPAADPEELEALVAAAISSRPEIAALRARAGSAEASVRVARAARLPQVSLAAGFEYSNPNLRSLPLEPAWRTNWSVGVAASLSAFDGGRASAAQASAQAQADALQSQVEELERAVRLEVTARALDLGEARESLLVATRSLESARENVQVSRDRFREGLTRNSELLDAETALLRADLDRTSALAGIRIAAARLDRAVGR
jgi:outer membrane protein TolC